MGFSRQEYCSGLPFPSPGDLPDPGIEPRFPALQADALISDPPGRHKFILREVQVKFYLGQNEDCSPGDSITDSSEKLLQRGRGEGQHLCDFGEGGVLAIKHIFLQKVSASHEEQSSSCRTLVLF